jgi:DNA-binding transcriptional LysR family regulator
LKKSKFAAARVSLDQWRALAAVVDEGGYVRAAQALGKSQSTVSHSVQRLEELLETRVLRLEGRRAVLTDTGRVVLRRARYLLDEASDIERVARALSVGVERDIAVAVDTVFPHLILMPALAAFASRYPGTRIDLFETVGSGAIDMLAGGGAQLAVTLDLPPGSLGSRLTELELLCVAGRGHPLHGLDRPLTVRDLRRHHEVAPRAPGAPRKSHSGRRLIVSTMGACIQALSRGLGFGWCPVTAILRELDEGLLVPLELPGGGIRHLSAYLVFADEESAGPAANALANLIEAAVMDAPERGLRKPVW